jgi:hypothetical protein
MLTGGDLKARDRQVKGLGKQAEASVVGSSIDRGGGHSEPQDTVGFADNRLAGRLRLKMGTKGGDIAILSNGNHY